MDQASSPSTTCNGDDKLVNGTRTTSDGPDPSDEIDNTIATPPPSSRKRAGSSCIALKSAVKNLASLDDFICEKLGAGFFSDVYKVTHRQTYQVMVLKMNTLSSNRHNMLSEVQLLNRLSHPNILRFMGVCVHEGQLHALTELCSGGCLEDLLGNSNKYLDWEVKLKIVLDIAAGMNYVHGRGVMHRDLTSMNCLLKNEGGNCYHGVIGDFGLACKIPRDNDTRLSIVGSPYWMAPECLKGLKYNERADLFSYGIILCETIARIPADPDVLPRLENFGVDADSFTLLSGDCPDDFLHLAFRCCEVNPIDRISFAEIVDQINNILTTLRDARIDAMTPDKEVEALISEGFVKSHRRAKSESGTPSPPHSPVPFTPPSFIHSNSDRSTSQFMSGNVHYNPFVNTPFGRNKLISSSDDTSVFEMSPASPPSSPLFSHDVMASLAKVNPSSRRRSSSLPTSPELRRASCASSSSNESVSWLSSSFNFTRKGKASMSSGLLGLQEKEIQDKLLGMKGSDTNKTGPDYPVNIGGGRRLDSGLSSLYDEDLERVSDAGNISVSKMTGRLDESCTSDLFRSSTGSTSTCSSIPSARHSLDLDGLPDNWDDKDNGDESYNKGAESK